MFSARLPWLQHFVGTTPKLGAQNYHDFPQSLIIPYRDSILSLNLLLVSDYHGNRSIWSDQKLSGHNRTILELVWKSGVHHNTWTDGDWYTQIVDNLNVAYFYLYSDSLQKEANSWWGSEFYYLLVQVKLKPKLPGLGNLVSTENSATWSILIFLLFGLFLCS